jgi:hypothetical protein
VQLNAWYLLNIYNKHAFPHFFLQSRKSRLSALFCCSSVSSTSPSPALCLDKTQLAIVVVKGDIILVQHHRLPAHVRLPAQLGVWNWRIQDFNIGYS